MTPERFRRVDQLVSLALERPANERAEFIREACAGEEDLRIEVESLLASHANKDAFLAEAPARPAAELLDERAEQELGKSPTVRRGGAALGRFRLLAELGRGGMGIVFVAYDPELGRKVAIKLVRPETSVTVSASEGRERLLREARAMAQISHPNVIAVHEVGTFAEQVFIAMEYVEGTTLGKWLSEKNRPWREVLAMFVQAGRGLAAAHSGGILHRDFKPENVLVGKDGRARVVDFGLARLAEPSKSGERNTASGQSPSGTTSHQRAMLAVTVTQRGKLVGTPAYMAPEQLTGEVVDAKTDQYSFCVALFQGLYGALPFNVENLGALLDQIRRHMVNKVFKSKNVPASLQQALLRGLSPEPADRFPSMEVLLDKLERQMAVRRRRTLEDRSIAVLPFASLGMGEENAYFARGFHDELLRQLGRIGDLRVISRTSVLQYKEEGNRSLREISEALGVSFIVEGSVQRVGNRVRVGARLIDARSDRQMWADRYDRDLTDVFGIQTAVAEEIAKTLQARISPAQKAQIERKPTESAAAYDLYLRALEYANRPGPQPGNLEIAERLYRQAIQADPSFALARARLAYVRMTTYWGVAGALDSVAEEAKQEAEHALRLQPDLPEGHLALGYYHYWGRLDYDRALKEFEVARSGVPAEAVEAIGFVLRRQGRFDEAIRYQQEAVHLDPRSPNTRGQLAESFIHTRRYGDADGVLDQVLTIAPDFTAASMIKAFVQEMWKGETTLAKKVIREARGRLDPQGRVGAQDWIISLLSHNPREALPFLDSLDSESITASDAVLPKAFLYAVAHESIGDAGQARKEYETALPWLAAEVEKNPSRPLHRSILARAYAGIGRKEDALREANRAVEILPISKDHGRGTSIEIECAAVEARVGETDAAIEHIRHLLSIPCLLSPPLLRIDPRWAPLHADQRFRKLAELDHQ
jgi:serine/threonine protein kinase/Tfp pilus assembly protein PilF